MVMISLDSHVTGEDPNPYVRAIVYTNWKGK